MVQAGSAASGDLHAVHLVMTILLFALNLLLTQLITNRRFIGRLRYVGHEMVFLSLGIVVARLFITSNYLILVLTLLVYIVVWASTLLLTKQVIDREDRLYPQVTFCLIIGILSVYFSAAGFVETKLVAFVGHH